MRLDKYLTSCGFGTRKDVKSLIRSGAVYVDGETTVRPDLAVSNDSDITVNGKKAVYREFVYIMMNKPQGYICAVEDRRHPVVTEILDQEYERFKLSPVGRLDIDTEGLLILTNDGAFNHALTSPKKNVYKTYFARLDKEAEECDIAAFADGMEFKDFKTKSAVLEICENKTEVFIKIAEGKYHQVKRMCEKVGKTVTYLKRTAIGELKLDETLNPGEYRELTEAELQQIMK